MATEQLDTTAGTAISTAATAATTASSLPAEPTGQGTAGGGPEDADLAEAFAKMEELTSGPIFHSGEPHRSFLDQLPADDAEALEVIDRSFNTYKTMIIDYLISVDDPPVDAEQRARVASRVAFDGKRTQTKTDAIRAMQAERRRILAAGMSEADTQAAIKAATTAAARRTSNSVHTIYRQEREERETMSVDMSAERRKAREAYNSSPRGIVMRQHAEELARAPVERWRRAVIAWLETEERREAVAKMKAAGDGA